MQKEQSVQGSMQADTKTAKMPEITKDWMVYQSNIKQIGVCTVKLRHKDKITRCRFFAVPGNGQVLLGMPNIELLGKMKIMCKVVREQLADRKCDSQTKTSIQWF